MKTAAAIVSVLVLTGCVSTPVPINQAINVPAERYFWTEQVKSKNPGRLIVTRDNGYVGMAVKADVAIDQTPLAALDMGEKVEVMLDPDTYVIDIDVAYITASANQEIKAGQTYYYRISTDNNAMTHLSRVKKPD